VHPFYLCNRDRSKTVCGVRHAELVHLLHDVGVGRIQVNAKQHLSQLSKITQAINWAFLKDNTYFFSSASKQPISSQLRMWSDSLVTLRLIVLSMSPRKLVIRGLISRKIYRSVAGPRSCLPQRGCYRCNSNKKKKSIRYNIPNTQSFPVP